VFNKTSPKQSEFDIIETYFKHLTRQKDVRLGIGDDAALVDLSGHESKHLVVATDTLVSGVHFPEDATADLIAQRALCVNLSDMAAMGAEPRWFTLALTLPKENAHSDWLTKFSQGLASIANKYNCALVGGDTTAGPLAITLTLLGEVGANRALTRSGAKPGDSIYVTGMLGDGGAGLEMIRNIDSVQDMGERARLAERFYSPRPRIAEGLTLSAVASACIDVSDGLIADLTHICVQSGVDARINSDKLPIHSRIKTNYPSQWFHWALFAGDDYELIFTVPQYHLEQVDQWIHEEALEAVKIGELTSWDGHSIRVKIDDMPVSAAKKGFDHFDC
jgi:thiamine-monophosphate kinase